MKKESRLYLANKRGLNFPPLRSHMRRTEEFVLKAYDNPRIFFRAIVSQESCPKHRTKERTWWIWELPLLPCAPVVPVLNRHHLSTYK